MLTKFFTDVATDPFRLCYQDCIYPYTLTCIAILDHSFIRTELCMLLAFSSTIAITNTTDLELLRNIYSWKNMPAPIMHSCYTILRWTYYLALNCQGYEPWKKCRPAVHW